MNLHLINDKYGMPTGVYIPISEWEELKNKYLIDDHSFELKGDKELIESLKSAINEVSLIEKGKLEKKSAFQLLEMF